MSEDGFAGPSDDAPEEGSTDETPGEGPSDDAPADGSADDAPGDESTGDGPDAGPAATASGADDGGPLLPAAPWRRALTVALLFVLLASLGTVVAIAMDPPETADPFTEFYLLGENGTAAGYPTTVSAGETLTVTVGVGNAEHEDVEYRLVARWNDSQAWERTVPVADGETEEFDVDVRAPSEAGRYRLEFRLYGGSEPIEEDYRYTRLWITVRS